MSALDWFVLAAIGVPTLIVASYPMHVWLARRSSRRYNTQSSGAPAVTISIIVPVKGHDEAGAQVLQRLLAQEAYGLAEIILCIEDGDDPAIPFLRRLESVHPSRVRVLITGESGLRLGKLHNLMAGIEAARGDRLVFVDSDTLLPHARYVERFTAPLADSRVGLVTCFPAYRRAESVPAAMLAGSINHDLVGHFAIESLWGGLRLANGPCMAIRRDVLDEIGGLEAQESSVLMDVILAQRVHGAGFRVIMHDQPVEVPCRTVTWRVWWNQIHRWHVGMSRVLAGPFYTWYLWMRTAFPVAFALALFADGPLMSIGIAATVCRFAAIVAVSQVFVSDRTQLRYLWLLPLIDLMTALGAWYALASRRIEWRGRVYRVRQRGVTERLA
jgi:ceramide glucosyltransferase